MRVENIGLALGEHGPDRASGIQVAKWPDPPSAESAHAHDPDPVVQPVIDGTVRVRDERDLVAALGKVEHPLTSGHFVRLGEIGKAKTFVGLHGREGYPTVSDCPPRWASRAAQ